MIKLLLRSSFAATQVDEMRGQRVVFDQKMARAVLDASGMKVAYDQLACDNAEQKQVQYRTKTGPLYHVTPSIHNYSLPTSFFPKVQARLRSILSDMLPAYVVSVGIGRGGGDFRYRCCNVHDGQSTPDQIRT